MRVIEELYVIFYRLSTFLRKVPGSSFYNQRFDSIFLISCTILLNFSTAWVYFKIKPLFTTHLLDFFLGLLVISGICSLYFERKSRYMIILEKYKKNPFLGFGMTFLICSIVIFIYVGYSSI
jgi:hypothetical protein